MIEEWKTVSGRNRYQVSSFGRVRRDGHFIKPVPVLSGGRKHGYKVYTVSLSQDGTIAYVKVANLVMDHFGTKKPKGKTLIRHLDGDQSKNGITNLAWVLIKRTARIWYCTAILQKEQRMATANYPIKKLERYASSTNIIARGSG